VEVKYFTDTKKLQEMVLDKRYVSVRSVKNQAGEYVHELVRKKKCIMRDTPVQVGFTILQLAKVKMLEFYYFFLDKYLDRKDFQLMTMQTDRFAIALAGDSIENLLKPELREEFEKDKPKFLADSSIRSQRTNGLFKLEAQGEGMIALRPNCYYIQGKDGDKSKTSGVTNSAYNKQYVKTWDAYKRVLLKDELVTAKNELIKTQKDGSIITYTEVKIGLSGFYDKMRVGFKDENDEYDRITCFPIDL
jgi:hypothetical protein